MFKNRCAVRTKPEGLKGSTCVMPLYRFTSVGVSNEVMNKKCLIQYEIFYIKLENTTSAIYRVSPSNHYF